MVTLTILRPDRERETVTFENPTEVTIGRSANCTLCLDADPMISRMHAVLLLTPPSVSIKDLNSTNGLMINCEPFGGISGRNLSQPRDLHDGDEVTIGSTVIGISIAGGDKGTKPTRAVRYEDNGTVVSARLSARKGGEYDAGGEGMDKTVGNLPAVRDLPKVPGYVIRGVAGTGRAGNVYQAVSSDGTETVAVKVISPDVAFSRKMLDDFSAEMEKVRAVRHPHLVKLIATGALGPRSMYLVTEYINGEDLFSYLKRCPNHRLPLHTAYGLMLQMASAMCHAHNSGFIHRDLIPENVLLYDENGGIMTKVTNVGLAKTLEDSGISGLVSSLPNARSIHYTAPEQLSELRDSKPTADVFSLSAIFYEMLTGSSPYSFEGTDERGRFEIVANGNIVPIEERLPGLPEPLVVIIERGLSKEPEERYQNCCDLLEALENVRVGKSRQSS